MEKFEKVTYIKNNNTAIICSNKNIKINNKNKNNDSHNNNNKRNISHAPIEQKLNFFNRNSNNNNNNTNTYNENTWQQKQQQQPHQKQQQNQRSKSTAQQRQEPQQQKHNHKNYAQTTITKTHESKQQQPQPQLTSNTADSFRTSAMYALLATSATTAAHTKRHGASDNAELKNDGDDDKRKGRDRNHAIEKEDDGNDRNAEGVNDDKRKASRRRSTHTQHLLTRSCTARSTLKVTTQSQTSLKSLNRRSIDDKRICCSTINGSAGDSSISRTRQLSADTNGGITSTDNRATDIQKENGFFSLFGGYTTFDTRSSGTSLVDVSVGLNIRSILYLTLVLCIYSGALMHDSVAATAIANATTTLNNKTMTLNSNTNETNAPSVAMTLRTETTEEMTTKVTFSFAPPQVYNLTNNANNETLIIIDDKNNNSVPKLNVSASMSQSNSKYALASFATPPTLTSTATLPVNTAKLTISTKSNHSQRSVSLAGVPYANSNETKEDVHSVVVKRDTAHVPDDEDDSAYHDDEFDEYEALINNRSAKGKYIGAPCFSDMTCESSLVHVVCDKETTTCGCERNYPVQLGLTKGCDKPKKLGEQCFYDETCMYNDENSLCVQVRHNAKCQCAHGFHSVSHTKPTRRVFCTKDLNELNSDLPTLLGVTTGIAVLAGLICMVLHLFSKTKYPRPRNFGDANLPPPIMYSSETGIPLTVQSGRPSSRSSLRSSASIGSYGNRRASSGGAISGGGGHGMMGGGGGGIGHSSSSGGGSKGILVSTSRTGAARSAAILLISCHLTELAKSETALRNTTPTGKSRQISRSGGGGCRANSRDNLDEKNGSRDGGVGGGGGGTTGGSGSRSCDSTLSMTRHLQKQLNHQRHLLSLELSPAKTKDNDRIRTLLGINGIDNYRTDDDDELNSLDHNHLQIGALPTPASETPRFAPHSYTFLGRRTYTRTCLADDISPQFTSSRSRRPSLASVHSTSSSVRSYSMMRFEKEVQQKEIRQEMKLRLARLQQQQHLNQNKPQIVIGDTLQHHMGAGSALSRLSGIPTPSPLTPNSMDELLPAVDELQEYPTKSDDLATTIHKMAADSVAASTLAAIKQAAVGTSTALATTTMGMTATTAAASAGASGSASGDLLTPATPSDNAGEMAAAAYLGPCSSSTEAL